jgi:enoyl-CoA hydratase/3-hydroxyacyl-CoA dehydrogenase
MTEKTNKGFESVLPEPVPLRKSRKGGAANLVFIALLLEAARMIDDGVDIPTVEAAAKKAFGTFKGFLQQMDEVGIPEAVHAMEALSSSSGPDDPFYQTYHNFFTPAESCRKKMEEYEKTEDKSRVKWISSKKIKEEPKDFMLIDLMKKRFQSVAFMTSVEVVEAGIVELKDMDRILKQAMGWKEGPFALMNRLGIGEAMRMVTEKMELSHRKEINFPIPRLLITQAQKNEPWPLNSKIQQA